MNQPTEKKDRLLFDLLLRRLQALERWRELAIRPSPDDCRPEDLDLLEAEQDDCRALAQRCRQARDQLNQNLPRRMYTGNYENDLRPRPSSIPGAGLGLFYEPISPNAECSISKGSLLCYYYGHLHDFHSAKLLTDRRYLMLVREGIMVDPGPLPHIKARYINDPLNADFVNCKFVPESDNYCSAVIATRSIEPREEIFVSYGDGYWSQHLTPGRPIKS